MSAGDTPAVLFYLLDRHALLAMTMGSKCVLLNSLTTPDGLIVYHCPNATYHMGRWALYYLAAEAPGITGVMDPPGTGIVAVGL